MKAKTAPSIQGKLYNTTGKGKVEGPMKKFLFANYFTSLGSCTYVDGATYEGAWLAGKKHGFGIMNFATEGRYEVLPENGQ